jgi:hypothetical protein
MTDKCIMGNNANTLWIIAMPMSTKHPESELMIRDRAWVIFDHDIHILILSMLFILQISSFQAKCTHIWVSLAYYANYIIKYFQH